MTASHRHPLREDRERWLLDADRGLRGATDAELLAQLRATARAGADLRASAHPARLQERIRKRFGDWAAGLLRAGVRVEDLPKHTHFTRRDAELALAQLRRRGVPGREAALALGAGVAARAIDRFVGDWNAPLEVRPAHALLPPHSRQPVDSPAGLLRLLRSLAPDGSMREGDMDEALVDLSRRYYGSVEGALCAAGLRVLRTKGKRITREVVVERLCEVAGPTRTVARKQLKTGLVNAARKAFGSLDVAARAAGIQIVYRFKPNAVSLDFPPGEVLQWVHAWWQRHGQLPGRWTHAGNPLYLATLRYFGTVARAAVLAGLPWDTLRLTWDDCLLEAVLQDLAARPRPPLDRQRLFDRLMNPARPLGWTRKSLHARLRRLEAPSVTLGQRAALQDELRAAQTGTPSWCPRDARMQHRFLYDWAVLEHGSWTRALRVADLKESRSKDALRIWEPRSVADRLRKSARQGRSLRADEAPPGLASAAKRMFGSWVQALLSAGIPLELVRAGNHWTRRSAALAAAQLKERGFDWFTASQAGLASVARAVRNHFPEWALAVSEGRAERARSPLVRPLLTSVIPNRPPDRRDRARRPGPDPEEALLDTLRRVAVQGVVETRSLKDSFVRRLRKRFDSVARACESAGLQWRRPPHETRADGKNVPPELLHWLRGFHAEHHRMPSGALDRGEDLRRYQELKKYCGTAARGALLAGISWRDVPHLDLDASLLVELLAAEIQSGRDPLRRGEGKDWLRLKLRARAMGLRWKEVVENARSAAR